MFCIGRKVYTGKKNLTTLLQKIEDKYGREGNCLLLEKELPARKNDGSHSTQNHSSTFILFLKQKLKYSFPRLMKVYDPN